MFSHRNCICIPLASMIFYLLFPNLATAQRSHDSSGRVYTQRVALAEPNANAAEVPETDIPTRAAEQEGFEQPGTETEEEPGEEDEYAPWTLFPEECETRIGGWEQIGYHSGSTGLFNDRPGKLNLHQSWLWIENEADGEKGFDLGYRADIVYGIDGQDTQSFGNPPGTWDYENGFDHGPYAWAIPQAYGSVAMGDLGVKIGHFYTPTGYEVVAAPGNFFYSHSLAFYNSEPLTHTGVLATYKVGEHLEAYGGWTTGWDTGFEQLNGSSSWLGGFAIDLTEKLRMTYISNAGNFGWRGEGYSHSLVFDWKISDKWNYVMQSDLVSTNGIVVAPEEGVAPFFVPGELDDNIGINQYLFYTISPKLIAGVRAEWWKSDAASFYEVTYGLNVKPHPNLVIRPEVRHQWSPTNALDYEDNTVFGIDGYVTF